MWIPRTAADLVAGLDGVQETSWLDFKREFPVAGENASIATDIAAMSTDGGVVIYGVAEDKATGIFSPAPIALKGCAERVSQVVASRVAGSPTFDCTELALDDGTGYLVVTVPLSPTAPHVVENGDTRRVYGRSGPRNVELTQGDLDRLYDRRARFEADELRQLQLAESLSAIQSGSEDQPGVFNLVIRPIGGPPDLMSHVVNVDDRTAFLMFVVNTLNKVAFQNEIGLNLTSLLTSGPYRRTTEGAAMFGGLGGGDKVCADLEVLNDGTIRLTVGSVMTPHDGGEYTFVRDDLLAKCALRTAHLASTIYEKSSYYGPVDFSYVLRDCAGAYSSGYFNFMRYPGADVPNTVSLVEQPHFRRVSSASLRRDNIQNTLSEVLNPLLRPIRAPAWPSPVLLSAIAP